MADERKYYVMPNDELEGYDIYKRNSIETEEGLKDERVCTIYSMEYLDSVLMALELEDMNGEENVQDSNIIFRDDIIED
jgi:hypothetical protein